MKRKVKAMQITLESFCTLLALFKAFVRNNDSSVSFQIADILKPIFLMVEDMRELKFEETLTYLLNDGVQYLEDFDKKEIASFIRFITDFQKEFDFVKGGENHE